MASIEERKNDDGSVSYRVKVRLKGYPTQTATFERKTDAKKWAQDRDHFMRNVLCILSIIFSIRLKETLERDVRC